MDIKYKSYAPKGIFQFIEKSQSKPKLKSKFSKSRFLNSKSVVNINV